MSPEKLGRYQILGELGKGAMGVVYLAQDPVIGRQLALKTFRFELAVEDDEIEQFRARFLREAQSAGILNHPNIVTIHDVVEDPTTGVFFIAMEYVKGTDLKRLMKRQGRLPLPFVLDVVAQIADGLDYAHAKGVVHRDVKPANIIITAEKKAKITDFGIARVNASNLTVEGQLLGTPNYMAPEQIQGKEVDHRADLFSLGVLLYELITGAKPFSGENLTVVTHRIVHGDFEPPDRAVRGLPPKLSEVLARALQKQPDDRYQRGAELASDLRAVLAPQEPKEDETPVATAPRGGSFLAADEATMGPGTTVPYVPARTAAEPTAVGPATSPGSVSTATALPSMPAPAAAERSAGIGRAAMIAGITLLLGLVVAVGGWLLWRPGEGVPEFRGQTLEEELQAKSSQLYREGLAALETGDFDVARTKLQEAHDMVPDNRRIKRALDQAIAGVITPADGELSREDQVTMKLSAARSAYQGGDYDGAIGHAREVLELDSRNREARQLIRDAEDGKSRRAYVTGRTAGRNSGSTPTTTETSPPPPAVAGSRPGTLLIDFYSQAPDGIVTVFAGQDQIFRREYSFTEKAGPFITRKTDGRIDASRELAAGDFDLKVYVVPQVDGRSGQTLSQSVQGQMLAGGSRTLRIAVRNGRLQVAVE